MTHREIFEQRKHFEEALAGESDMLLAIVAATYLDNSLSALLSGAFDQPHIAKKLLSVNGPLGTFSVRADLAFCLGHLDEQEHEEIQAIASIRNQFAHKLDKIHFASPTIIEKCKGLNSWKKLKWDGISGGMPRNLSAKDRFRLSSLALFNTLLAMASDLTLGH